MENEAACIINTFLFISCTTFTWFSVQKQKTGHPRHAVSVMSSTNSSLENILKGSDFARKFTSLHVRKLHENRFDKLKTLNGLFFKKYSSVHLKMVRMLNCMCISAQL